MPSKTSSPARVFAERLNRMLNTTVTDGRLVLTRSPGCVWHAIAEWGVEARTED